MDPKSEAQSTQTEAGSHTKYYGILEQKCHIRAS